MPTKQIASPTISCKATLFAIGSSTIFHLPAEPSQKLPSRGQVMVTGTFNDIDFQTPLEPDGKLGHYFKVEPSLLKAANVKSGDAVSLSIAATKDWPEPEVPADWRKALKSSDTAETVWHDITPMARWEWIRWIRSTGRDETRTKRIGVGISKIEGGSRRPCCWNRNLSTEPDISKSGVLLVPAN